MIPDLEVNIIRQWESWSLRNLSASLSVKNMKFKNRDKISDVRFNIY